MKQLNGYVAFDGTHFKADEYDLCASYEHWIESGILKFLDSNCNPVEGTCIEKLQEANLLYVGSSEVYHYLRSLYKNYGIRVPEGSGCYIYNANTDYWRNLDIDVKELREELEYTESLISILRDGRDEYEEF